MCPTLPEGFQNFVGLPGKPGPKGEPGDPAPARVSAEGGLQDSIKKPGGIIMERSWAEGLETSHGHRDLVSRESRILVAWG